LEEDHLRQRSGVYLGQARLSELSAPIYASLVKAEGDESFTLICSRRDGD
jgi:hypothetical protein